MLSYHTEPRRIRTCSYWLGLAIHFAREAQAYTYQDARHSASHRRTLKRLWWACILRDQIVSLGLHRPLLISSDDFDFTLPYLNADDLMVNMPGSYAYDNRTRQDMAIIIEQTCKQAVVFVDLLMLISPRKEPFLPDSETEARRAAVRADRCRISLQNWYEESSPTFARLERNDHAHRLTHVQINLTYVYYQ